MDWFIGTVIQTVVGGALFLIAFFIMRVLVNLVSVVFIMIGSVLMKLALDMEGVGVSRVSGHVLVTTLAAIVILLWIFNFIGTNVLRAIGGLG